MKLVGSTYPSMFACVVLWGWLGLEAVLVAKVCSRLQKFLVACMMFEAFVFRSFHLSGKTEGEYRAANQN